MWDNLEFLLNSSNCDYIERKKIGEMKYIYILCELLAESVFRRIKFGILTDVVEIMKWSSNTNTYMYSGRESGNHRSLIMNYSHIIYSNLCNFKFFD